MMHDAWIVVLGALGGFSAGEPATATTLVSIRAEHAARAGAIRTLVIEEEVYTQESRSPELEAARRARLEDLVTKRAERVVASLNQEKLTPAELQRVSRRALDDARSVLDPEQAMLVWAANEEITARQRSSYDFVGLQCRVEQRDLRDLDGISKQLGITDLQRASLDATLTTIETREFTLRVALADELATVLRGSSFLLGERLELCGVLPAEWLTGSFPTQVTAGEDGTVRLRTHWDDSERPALDVCLDRRGRVRSLVHYGRDGEKVREVQLSDYRQVDPGVWIPFHSESYRRLGPHSGERTEVRDVVSVQVNRPLADDAFEAPRGARLQPMDPTALSAYLKHKEARNAAKE